jgi:lactate permease
VALEAGALVACGLLLLVRLPRDAGGFGTGRSARKAALRAALPYLALTLAVLATRSLAPLRGLLEGTLALQPAAGLPPFPPLYHVGVLILAVALATGASARLSGAAWRAALAETAQKARAPVLVTLLFVAMGRVTAETGMAAALMADLTAAAGSAAVLAVPLPAALAGFLTGSNVAANAIMMPLQVGLAEQAGAPVRWVAGLQNLAGSTFTLLSPIRVAMGVALVGLAGSDARVYRTAAPIGAVALALLLLEAAVILAL